MSEKDFLDEIMAERTARNPRFPDLVAEAARRREIARSLAAKRERLGMSQTVVAARMGTAASVVSKLESGLSRPGATRRDDYSSVPRNSAISLPPSSGQPWVPPL
jgi:DNA-binding transcriptional regulator YiaG